MIEAYTIGIKLALDDGVTAGIVQLRAEMSALQRAIDLAASGLQHLSDLGKGLAAPVPFVPPARTERLPAVKPERPAENPGSEIESEPPAIPNRSSGVSTDGRSHAARDGYAPPTDARAAPVKQAAAPQPDAVGPVPSFAELAALAIPPLRAPLVPPPQVAESPAPLASTSSALLPATVQSSRAETILAPAHRPAFGFSGEDRSIRSSDPVPGGFAPKAPRIRHMPISGGDPAPPPVQFAQPEPAQPPREDVGHPMSFGGELLLDGARLGRWFSEELDAFAARPLAGTTAMDPRQTPGWPGSLRD